jgi:hypothetical protein
VLLLLPFRSVIELLTCCAGIAMKPDYDQLLCKKPKKFDAIFAWHQDMAYWPPVSMTPHTGDVFILMPSNEGLALNLPAVSMMRAQKLQRSLSPSMPPPSKMDASSSFPRLHNEKT